MAMAWTQRAQEKAQERKAVAYLHPQSWRRSCDIAQRRIERRTPVRCYGLHQFLNYLLLLKTIIFCQVATIGKTRYLEVLSNIIYYNNQTLIV